MPRADHALAAEGERRSRGELGGDGLALFAEPVAAVRRAVGADCILWRLAEEVTGSPCKPSS
jgi:hypothetical protein